METVMENEENFAEMFERHYKEPEKMEPGRRVEAPIVKLTPEWALIEVGGKGEGYIPVSELKDAEGNLLVKEGDKIRAYFLHTEEGEMRFTTKIGTGPAARAQLMDAFNNHIPLEGTVAKEMKGGFEVTISGGMRAFCPFSQMGIRREESKEAYIGVSMVFYIIECGRRDVVLSRREIVEKERQEKVAALKETLKEGAKVRGVVTSIQKFGAFIDIGGVDGLLPVSEMAWGRTEKVSDLLAAGQPVEVIIKSLDWENRRISLSLKDTLPNPWDTAAEQWPSGSYHTGVVSRLAPFGAFITLGAGVDGLIHVSRLGGERRINHPEDVLKAGQSIEVRVETVDLENKRISLIPAALSREEDESTATMQKYQQQEVADEPAMGSLGEQLKRQLEKNRIDE
ncbi:MAG: 30S ribosomal protein S1 [Elusimicrobia bacterium CG_4_10_14_0_2_um_filter_56_8]|nr:MAG: 30S ribosomal protein S1 [Elusimicrobia bacterium CG1_02_56_21]PJA11405.1 MAG: 30S ribosomal protein S1 [Elusimicrobia bacterium CG_4_10_14_0_2_um_filter_56_8]